MSEQPGTASPEGQTSRDTVRQGIDFSYDTMDGIIAAANVNAVYGEPIRTEHGQLVVPATEVITYAGYAIGTGGGPANTGSGMGSGGGGRVLSRPVAVIIADQNGVQVKPVLDTSKILLTILSTLGFITASWLGMRNTRKYRKQPEIDQL